MAEFQPGDRVELFRNDCPSAAVPGCAPMGFLDTVVEVARVEGVHCYGIRLKSGVDDGLYGQSNWTPACCWRRLGDNPFIAECLRSAQEPEPAAQPILEPAE